MRLTISPDSSDRQTYLKIKNVDKFEQVWNNIKKYAKAQNLWGLKDKLGRKWRLTLVAEALGFSSENAHDALADVMMLKNIWFMVDPIVHPADWEDDTAVSLF